MADLNYIADSAPLPTFSLVPQGRSDLTYVRCTRSTNPVAHATAASCSITQLFIG